MNITTYTPSENIHLIDTLHLGRDQVIGSYLLLGDAPILVDPGPTSTLATVEQGLASHGLGLGDLQALLLTHIHLDHAGATGTILARHPHIRVYVHERGAPHLINPEKLLGSATRLYGDLMDVLWGEFLPVPDQRVTVLRGGETLQIGGRMLDVRYGPGHASHHVVYIDQTSGAAFVGDNGGVRLPGSTYARPATPPPDIDLEAWDRTLTMIGELRPRLLCLTHFGPVFDPAEHLQSYRERLHRWAELVGSSIAQGEDDTVNLARLQELAVQELHDTPGEAERYEQATPLYQSWQGLNRYWQRRRA
ncbi:MAG: MBL fold metallo-hydrolase [Roseiflexaceae bacterium]|nr:MBL fold metallo-hydrolase [Roseiflexaceae bacterium]